MNALTATGLQAMANPFQFTDHAVRTAVDERANPWFCAKDVFAALDIAWKGSAGSLKNYPENWQGVCYCQTPQGVQEVLFISEPGVYQTIFASRKPEARAFANWVCEEVLPTIRRQGFYGQAKLSERVALSRQLTCLVLAIVATRDAFARTALLREMQEVCNLLGQPMPDVSLLGTDADQIPLALGRVN